MNKKITLWLIIAGVLIVIGGVIFVATMAANNWDFSKMSSSKFETNTHTVTEEFDGISINTNTSDVRFVLSEDGEAKVECYEKSSVKHSVSVRGGKLVVEAVDNSKWHEWIWSFGLPTITVYLPETEYSSLTVQTDTGDVELPHGFRFGSVELSTTTGDIDCFASADSMKIAVTTGDICVENALVETLSLSLTTGKTELKNVACENLTIGGTTGNIELDGVIASEKILVELSTGDVRLNGCDGAELFIKTSTGNVKGSLLTEKIFFASSDTGRVDVPKATTGGTCEIRTSTGDIRITIG